MSQEIKDIKGKKYSKLTAIKFSHSHGEVYYWIFKCECGKKITANRKLVISRSKKHCGCEGYTKLAQKCYKCKKSASGHPKCESCHLLIHGDSKYCSDIRCLPNHGQKNSNSI